MATVIGENDSSSTEQYSFASHLQALRIARGFSLGALARTSQVNKSTLSRWEAGLRQPSIAEMDAVLAALQATPTERAKALASFHSPRAVQALRKGKEGITSPPATGDLLRAMRLRKGKTLAETASAVGVSHSTVLRWERSESWPSNEQLHSLGYALSAHVSEIAALTAGNGPWLSPEAFSLAGPTMPSEEHRRFMARRLDSLAYDQGWTAEQASLRDLSFLSLQATLWPLAHRSNHATSSAYRHLLTHTYARYAQFLGEQARWQEAAQSAQQSLDTVTPLFQSPGERLQLERTAWPVAAIMSVRAMVHQQGNGMIRRRKAAEQGIRILSTWLERQPGRPGYSAWLLSEIADYFALNGDREYAIEYMQKACREVEEGPEVIEVEVTLRRRDYARLLTETGRPAEAMSVLQSVAGWKGQPMHEASEALIWAEALFASGDRTAASEKLNRVETMICQNRLGALRPRAEALARVL